MNFSEWFSQQSLSKQKEIVMLLFSLRMDVKKLNKLSLFDEMLSIIDNEYHKNKGDG